MPEHIPKKKKSHNQCNGGERKLYESARDIKSMPTVQLFKERNAINSRRTNQNEECDANGIKRICGENGEYIEGIWENKKLIELKSFQFIYPKSEKSAYVRRQGSDYLFIFDDELFIARMFFKNNPNLVQGGFTTMKTELFKRLTVTEIIEDTLLSERDSSYDPLTEYLQEINDKTANNLNYAEDIFQVYLILNKYYKFPDRIILENIVENEYVSPKFKSIATDLLFAEENLETRRKDFPRIKNFLPKTLSKDLQKSYNNCFKSHKQSLVDECCLFYSDFEDIVVDKIWSLSNHQVLYLSKNDIRLFSDMANEIKGKPFVEFYENLQNKFLRYIKPLDNRNCLKAVAPLTDPIYYYLFKGFREIIGEIGKLTNMTQENLLQYNNGAWQLAESIRWTQTSSVLNQSLEQQYKFVFLLMQHFEPGCDKRTTQFFYEFKILQDGKWRTKMEQKQLVWMYFLDNAIAGIITSEKLQWYESLIDGCKEFLTKTGEQYESFRVISQNCARFIVQTSPYLSENVVKIDQDILTKQIEYINKAIKMEALTNFRDLIDVYNEYWSNRERITVRLPEKFPHGQFKKKLQNISENLLNLLLKVLSCDVQPEQVIKYFRVFNEFVGDLDAVDYRWIVKKEAGIPDCYVTIINKKKNSYFISEPENFIENINTTPRHFVIEIIEELLKYIIKLFNSNNWSEYYKVNAAADLITAIKKSFIYLKDQSNYESFELFMDESTKPFILAVENSLSYEEFSKRVGVIGESFWYIRKQDEIKIDDALELYKKENSCQQVGNMESCYKIYDDKFKYYISQTYSKSYTEKIMFVVSTVQAQLDQRNFNTWDVKFKREVLLEVLAGLAAVWSIVESKDIAITGKCLKPHCIQILCIIRLLSIDEDCKGVDKHLAQVLTGQGKSLVLGLLSSLLALTDHKVRTVCYSNYLATRDQEDFAEFFKIFNIRDKIVYDTFSDMASDLLCVEVDGTKQDLRNLVATRILKHNERKSGKFQNNKVNKTILLIDEVDVFFSDQFYGSNYGACNTIYLPGLEKIQEKVWELVLNGNNEENAIYSLIESYIKDKNNSDHLKEFNKYLLKGGQFWLLENNKEVIEKEYNNGSLFWEHLKQMIKNAIIVKKANDTDRIISEYIINDNGKIACKRNDGIYCENTHEEYYNIFVYFRLKKKNFDKKNYGYLNVYCGRISYAKLPAEYPLILGVSGTLTTLNKHEKEAVKDVYEIKKNTVMPSYFGKLKLRFSSSENFAITNSEDEWNNKIFHEANSKVSSGTSVLVFFKTDANIAKFKEKFCSKFDRLHVLTENSKDYEKKKIVEEAGIPKTIILSTRGMGRGVDYKSSVAVEKSGGTHVIQTFFSLDIKEEIQIKGRTARKDNDGSYELILCKEHLIKDRYIKKGDCLPSYGKLNELREEKMNEKRSNDKENIKKAEKDHDVTMKYLKSFCK